MKSFSRLLAPNREGDIMVTLLVTHKVVLYMQQSECFLSHWFVCLLLAMVQYVWICFYWIWTSVLRIVMVVMDEKRYKVDVLYTNNAQWMIIAYAWHVEKRGFIQLCDHVPLSWWWWVSASQNLEERNTCHRDVHVFHPLTPTYFKMSAPVLVMSKASSFIALVSCFVLMRHRYRYQHGTRIRPQGADLKHYCCQGNRGITCSRWRHLAHPTIPFHRPFLISFAPVLVHVPC